MAAPSTQQGGKAAGRNMTDGDERRETFNRALTMRPFWQAFFDGTMPEHEDLVPPCAVEFDPTLIYWVTKNLPHTEAVKHFLVCGTVGSGKTTVIQLFLQSIAKRFQPGHDTPEQLIIFDAKGDAIVRLKALGLGPRSEPIPGLPRDKDIVRMNDPGSLPQGNNVYILNPFDKRAASWNLSEAIKTPAMARYLAALLIPEETGSTAPYFSNTAREILYWSALSLNKIRGSDGWTLRDLLNAVESKERIAAVTAQHNRASRVIKQHLDDERHFPGVLSTLATKIGKFEEVAALWHTNTSGQKFSITKFLKEPGVLILPHDPVLQKSLGPINAIILQALTDEILRGKETKEPRHWFLLDEFRSMGDVQCIRDLLNVGRSKGASVLIGIQSVEGLMEIYKEHVTNEMLSLCSTKTFLRAGGPFTAEWAERHFNKVRHIELTVTETSGVTDSTSVQYQLQERSLFLPVMFLDLPFPILGGPFGAISDIPYLRTTFITERWFDELLGLKVDPSEEDERAEKEGNFFRSDPEEQIITVWKPTEVAEFCDVLPPKEEPRPGTIPLISKEAQQKRRKGPHTTNED